MPSQMPFLDDEGTVPSTPVASTSQNTTLLPAASASAYDTQQVSPLSLQPSLSHSSKDSNAGQYLLPIPTSSVNKSQASFAYSDISNSDLEGPYLGALPPEIALADIFIAPDGSFVETSSGPAARELKRRYDQSLGVGMEVRSPYAITAFVNQHGKDMYRVGDRELSAPATSLANSDSRLSVPNISDSEHLQAPKGKRRSRMSVHTFIPPSLKNVITQQPLPNATGPQEIVPAAPRGKLRKTRSIPDMFNGSSYNSSSVNLCGPEAGPSTFTGRAHSHSVTGADMPRLPAAMVDVARAPNGDLFGDVMQWTGTIHPSFPSGSGSARFARVHMSHADGSTPEYSHPPRVFPQPFGPNVAFDLPSRKHTADFLTMPHMLREVQSFESGLTARAGDLEPRGLGKPDSPLSMPLEFNIEDHSTDSTPHASYLPIIKEPAIDLEPDTDPPDSPYLAPLPETSMHSRYSTDVFDVLQTYSGLPLLDRMDDSTVIKMSYQPNDTATPRDDPRFVLWGDIKVLERDDLSVSQGSRTDLSSSGPSSIASRRKSSKAGKTEDDPPTFRVPPDDNSHRILAAATIERWIAQLTSDLNYDELLNFFLTYRTYISAVDLCHLLICRFHWALGKNSSTHDEMVKRIVRVRTFVAIRYWLLTFFNVDFLPNRELRLSLAGWLNALVRDPILKIHSDGLSIVRKLIKVVKDCKEAHTRKARSSTKPPKAASKLRSTVSHVLGDKFAEATYKDAESDSDVDLDFLPEEEGMSNSMGGFQSDSVNAHLSAVHDGTGLSSIPKPALVPSASAAILHQTLPLNILQQSRALASGVNTPFLQSPTSLPVHHQSSLSRVFVKTIGRLGHWKRVLNSRHAVQPPPGGSADVSVFDLELNAEGDLLAVRGGVEQYLKIIDQQPPPPVRISAPTPPPSERGVSHTVTVSEARSSTIVDDDDSLDFIEHGSIQSRPKTEASENATVGDEKPTPPVLPAKMFMKPKTRSSAGSSSDSSFGSPIHSKSISSSIPEPSTERLAGGFDVVSIDDLDLSDTSSDVHGAVQSPPGLKKLPRKLPLRRDFEFVRRPRESVSSMGITSYPSVVSDTSVASGGEAEKAGVGLFQQWQLNAIVDSLSDNEESGDIDATLRRLEGQINPQKQQEKVSKVDGWVKTIQERMAAGDYTDEAPRFLDYEGAEDGEPDIDDDTRSAHWSEYNDNEDSTGPTNSISQGPSSRASQESVVLAAPSASVLVPTTAVSNPCGPALPHRPPGARPSPEDVLPPEILQGRVPSRPSTSHGPSSNKPASPTIQPASLTSAPKLVNNRSYRSWILGYKAQTVVEHFSMIDRELFMGVKFEELVLDDWMSCEEVNVLDWTQFLKDRARWKAESRLAHKTSALAAVRARFNLVAHFTLSEVVLTQPQDRAILVKKFIRIAWKAYCYSNYNTLVAIMTGLQSEWVTKVMRNIWHRVGAWENRVFEDLRAWTDAKDDFKFIRQAVTSIIDAKPINVVSHAASVVSTGATDGLSSRSKATSDSKPPAPLGCIPFIGIYLSQLYRHSKLPDLIDPTAPNEMVGVDPETGNFDAPAHAEVFSDLAPLPSSMQLEPLINVHKQRLIADVIKMLVAGQHLASRVQYPVDKKLFQKCLKIRGLSSEMLLRAQAMYE